MKSTILNSFFVCFCLLIGFTRIWFEIVSNYSQVREGRVNNIGNMAEENRKWNNMRIKRGVKEQGVGRVYIYIYISEYMKGGKKGELFCFCLLVKFC
jgi:hypothetical protein